MSINVTFVENNAALSQICNLAARAGWLALDTECIREKTYYPRPALVQVAVDAEVALIDPVAVTDLGALRELLASSGVLKIIHCAQQDFEVLERVGCPVQTPVFDTQLAAAFAGLGHQIGYKSLVMQCLGAELEKDCTRSDWLQRPLSEPQKRYAVNDVIHLRPLYKTLLDKLRRQNKESWFVEESEHNLKRSGERDTADAWLKVGGGGKLKSGAEKRRLKRLAEWREQKARAVDLPRRWLLGDDCLVAIAMLHPVSAAAIEQLEPCRRKRIKSLARDIEALLTQAPRENDVKTQAPGKTGTHAGRGDAAQRKRVEDLLALVREIARSHNIEPALLATRKQLVQLVGTKAARETAPLLNGWRSRLSEGRIEALLDRP